MKPPEMAGWNLALRFGLELAALIALGAAAWTATTGVVQWIAVIIVPLAAAAVWGVFNVLDDPSRSGEAPVEVPGWVRLALELAVLAGGAVAAGYAWGSGVGISLAVVVVFHYAVSWARVRWLLGE